MVVFMLNNSRKLALLLVLRKLERKSTFVQMPELMQKLGDQFVERSVRRWLDELVAEGLVEKGGQKRLTYYRTISKGITAASKENNPKENNLDENQFSFSTKAQKSLDAIHKPLLK